MLAAVLTGLLAAPGPVPAVEWGLTPSHVFSLWTNVNDSLIAVARVVSVDGALPERIAAMTPRAFTGKTPADVLERAAEFRANFDRLRRKGDLAPTEQFAGYDGAVTPSVVFVNSGHVLTGVVDWLVRNTGPELTVSQFYTRHQASNKTPSHTFGLVDLADRRLAEILREVGV